MELKYTVTKTDISLGVKEILKSEFNISLRQLRNLINQKSITINGSVYDEKERTVLSEGDEITVNFDYEEDNSNIVPTKMDLDIEYEDDWMIIINKPSGMPVHPSMQHYEDSLSNGIRYYFDSINLKKLIRPVNRIDTNTSGLVLFAKCEYIHSVLSQQMQDKIFKKKYLTIVEGTLDKKHGTIDLPIARKPNSIIERCISPDGQKAITHYRVLDSTQATEPLTGENKKYSLVECDLETGRTHQIRVHFAYLGHPVLGDSLYGSASNLIEGQALHSYYMRFIHPISGYGETFIHKPNWKLFKKDFPLDVDII